MHFIEEDVLKILITNEEINTRCQELAKEIDRDYEAKFWGTAKYDFAEWYKEFYNI